MLRGQARRLILTTSRQIPPIQEWEADPDFAWVRSLQKKGAIIEVVPLDVCSEASVKAFQKSMAFEKVRGVLYRAGIIDYQVLDVLTPVQLRKVLDVKITGAWALHQLFKSQPLEHLVFLFNSQLYP